ncbi:YugN family protein [Bacillus fonticola]|uniref:YugN family protein n=1 Tax=Bacillus fonticola TaxID=2728853 RepID=UPI0014758D85|nr:YugN family protein [Bacillus fonticola]
MKIENTELELKKANLSRLDEIMQNFGLLRADQWDYERVTYDRRFEMKEGTFYLRVRAFAIEGDVGGRRDAMMQIMVPLLGKHYYPHGVEYGDGEHFPKTLVNQCNRILAEVNEVLESIAE